MIGIRLTSKGFRHSTHLCSNSGWSLVCDWFDSLPRGRFPALSWLWAKERFKPTSDLAEQLEAALAAYPPSDPYAMEHANRLADYLGGGHKNETITIER